MRAIRYCGCSADQSHFRVRSQLKTAQRERDAPARGRSSRRGSGRLGLLAAAGSETAEDGAPVGSRWLNVQRYSAQGCDFLRGSTPSTRTRGKGDCTWVADRPEIVIGGRGAALDDLDIARNTACRCISHRGDLTEWNFDIRIPTFPHQSTSDPASDNDAVIPNEKRPVPASQSTAHHRDHRSVKERP
jgi:hypothetical protein